MSPWVRWVAAGAVGLLGMEVPYHIMQPTVHETVFLCVGQIGGALTMLAILAIVGRKA